MHYNIQDQKKAATVVKYRPWAEKAGTRCRRCKTVSLIYPETSTGPPGQKKEKNTADTQVTTHFRVLFFVYVESRFACDFFPAHDRGSTVFFFPSDGKVRLLGEENQAGPRRLVPHQRKDETLLMPYWT